MQNFWNHAAAFLRDRNGASAAEYALILAIVGSAIAAAAIFLGNTIATAMNDAATCIQTAGGTCN
jgi:pilus assembly protein Flp/PilA